MSELRLAVWMDSELPRHGYREADGVPFVQSKTIWDVEEVCEILNHIESFADNAPCPAELRIMR